MAYCRSKLQTEVEAFLNDFHLSNAIFVIPVYVRLTHIKL